MSRPGGRRSEDDLRAAFAAKATQAPRADDVLRAVRRATRPRPSRLRWLLPAAAAAAAVAVAVPLALSLSDSNHGSEKAPEKAAGAGDARTQFHAQPAPSAMAADNAVCRPDQVRAAVKVRRDAGVERATLTVTALADCTLARAPRVTWNGATVRADGALAPADSARGSSGSAGSGGSNGSGGAAQRPENQYGRLAAGTTATATIAAADPCTARSGDAVSVDWGAGAVELHATGAAPACASPARPSPQLSVGPFTGLS